MPIRPEMRALYPKDWKQIVAAVAERSGGQCECLGECGIDHEGRCPAINHEPHPVTASKVVLTTAHLDHDPSGRDLLRLRHMCQRCHNRYDMPMRRAGIKARAKEKMAAGDLLETVTP